MSIPVVGTWIATGLFGGEFPGQEFIPRIYGVHVLLLPGAIVALVAVHLGLVSATSTPSSPGPGAQNTTSSASGWYPASLSPQPPTSSS
jgi:ubiquinol-cytochrome c reductase cytochrome b subunit